MVSKGSLPGAYTARTAARAALPEIEPSIPPTLPEYVKRDPLALEFFLRMLFSALVDADKLDTERHANSWKSIARGSNVLIADLLHLLELDTNKVAAVADDTPVNRVRREVYDSCRAAAEQPTGLFTLTVPTGGGKTRSAMAFALAHARRWDLHGVVVAVPFITITEQTATVYRDLFDANRSGTPAVLEHHSNALTGEVDDEGFSQRQVWNRLAAENWDAPIVVTTTVQLFESLFAGGASRPRRAHRLAKRVIILDEAQALPARVLDPILDALRTLCERYGSTVVLSTATQPAFETIPAFARLPAHEIVAEHGRHFQELRRVEYTWHTEDPLTWDQTASLMRDELQALAVLNTRRDALALFDALGDPEALHLSALLCGAHRRTVVAEVRRRLKAREPCRLVATQVVEAGVDLDFPMVLRALGPLDSIIQAAGRCNREGKMPDRGRVIVFQLAQGTRLPGNEYEIGTGVTRAMLGGRDTLDMHAPDTPRDYFRNLFPRVGSLDAHRIQEARAALDFPETAARFRMIDEDTVPVAITSYGSGEQRREARTILDRLKGGSPDARRLHRRLQPYLVNIRRGLADRYTKQGLILPVTEDLSEWVASYHPVLGIGTHDLELIL